MNRWTVCLREVYGGTNSGYVVAGYNCVFVCIYSPYIVVSVCLQANIRVHRKTPEHVVAVANTIAHNETKHTSPCVMARVCVFQSLGIPVKTHTFLTIHMWSIFIGPALTSPWQPTQRGGISLLPVWESLAWTEDTLKRTFSPHLFELHEALFSASCYTVCGFCTICRFWFFWRHTIILTFKL